MKSLALAITSVLVWFYVLPISCYPHNADEDSPILSTVQRNCLDNFISRSHLITEDIKKSSKLCLRNDNDSILHSEIIENVKQLQELMSKCVSNISSSDVVICMKSVPAEIKKTLEGIASSTKHLSQHSECLNETLEKALFENSYASFDLDLCLNYISSSTVTVTVTRPIEISDTKDKFVDILASIKAKYDTLKACTLNGSDYEKCWIEARIKSRNLTVYLENHFTQNSIEAYNEMTKIDEAENSCLRQYFIKIIVPEFRFDLEKCLRLGKHLSAETEENVENDMQLIRKLKNIQEIFGKCREITINLNIQMCVYKTLSKNSLIAEYQYEISRKSEDNFKKLQKIIKDHETQEHPCIEAFYNYAQYIGLNLNETERKSGIDCLMKGYKETPSNFAENIISNLGKIQDFISMCTAHPLSPGFEQCFWSSYEVYELDFIYYINTMKENKKEVIDEYDKNHHTCYGGIIQEIAEILTGRPKLFTFPKAENCILSSSETKNIANW